MHGSGCGAVSGWHWARVAGSRFLGSKKLAVWARGDVNRRPVSSAVMHCSPAPLPSLPRCARASLKARPRLLCSLRYGPAGERFSYAAQSLVAFRKSPDAFALRAGLPGPGRETLVPHSAGPRKGSQQSAGMLLTLARSSADEDPVILISLRTTPKQHE